MLQENYFSSAIKYITKKGYGNIKANYEGYEMPSGFMRKDEEEAIIPDITASRGDQKSYIEIAMKSEIVKQKISKWKLLDTMASVKGGRLLLLTPKGHKAFVQRIMDRYRINATLVNLPN